MTTEESTNSETQTAAEARTLAAITSVTSLLALIFLVAFTVTLVLLLHIQRHKNCNNQGTPIQAPEANYSTVNLPLPPDRIMSEKNQAYGYLESQAASFTMADNSAYGILLHDMETVDL